VQTTATGFCVCCAIPKAKNAAQRSSAMLYQRKLELLVIPIVNGAFLEPGEIMIS
jgi:hypothetical protein